MSHKRLCGVPPRVPFGKGKHEENGGPSSAFFWAKPTLDTWYSSFHLQCAEVKHRPSLWRCFSFHSDADGFVRKPSDKAIFASQRKEPRKRQWSVGEALGFRIHCIHSWVSKALKKRWLRRNSHFSSPQRYLVCKKWRRGFKTHVFSSSVAKKKHRIFQRTTPLRCGARAARPWSSRGRDGCEQTGCVWLKRDDARSLQKNTNYNRNDWEEQENQIQKS